MQMMKERSEHVGMNYPEVPDSRCVAKPDDDFFFPWEEEGSVESPITIEEDEGFSEPDFVVFENFFTYLLKNQEKTCKLVKLNNFFLHC